jgi:two-component system response regulator DctR
MARMSGLALQQRLAAIGARIPIVFISGHGDITMAVKAVKDGAVDFVQKPYREQQLLDAINEALRRDAALRAAPVASVKEGTAERIAALTEREREVMTLALQGLSNKLIATQLAISHRTVEEHHNRLLEKLQVGSIIELRRLNIVLHSLILGQRLPGCWARNARTYVVIRARRDRPSVDSASR